jgi:hypothetical protein
MFAILRGANRRRHEVDSRALPAGWAWLKLLLDALAKVGGN